MQLDAYITSPSPVSASPNLQHAAPQCTLAHRYLRRTHRSEIRPLELTPTPTAAPHPKTQAIDASLVMISSCQSSFVFSTRNKWTRTAVMGPQLTRRRSRRDLEFCQPPALLVAHSSQFRPKCWRVKDKSGQRTESFPSAAANGFEAPQLALPSARLRILRSQRSAPSGLWASFGLIGPRISVLSIL